MSKFFLKIFLPAAGLGERLRPITYHLPKPLLPILGKPLIEITLEKFSKISSGKIGINLHYKPEMIKEWVRNSAFAERAEFFPESVILGTGGALKNAERFLSDNHFLVHNADILSDIDFIQLMGTHLASDNIATLATHDYPKYNNVIINDNGYVIDVENPGTSRPNPERIAKKVAYTGIAVYSPEIFKFLPSGVSHATVAWLNAAKAGYKVQALDFTNCCWKDIGTSAAYASAVIEALRNDGETLYIHPSIKNCNDLDMDGYVVIEKGNEMPENIFLKNCIMLPETKIDHMSEGIASSISTSAVRGSKGMFENCILVHDFKVDLSESEMPGYSKETGGILIGTGGSNRKYYRIKKENKTAVLMKCAKDDADYHRHIEYTKFFSKHFIPVPELIEEKPDKLEAVFEDLGDISLYSRLKCMRASEQIEDIYKKVLDIAIQIHTRATENISECPILQNRLFDYKHYRWESNYFIVRFVEGIRNIKVTNLQALQDELHSLAHRADSFPKTVIHRDFQSQNIMIHNKMPRLIDYQGARMGSSAYDIASILWDPYYRLEDNIRERLLEYYISEMKKYQHPIPPFSRGGLEGINDFGKGSFMESLLLCRLQRHMQALGAYGFLSKIKSKKYFLKYIPEGLRLLKEDVSTTKDEYPALYRLVMEI